MSNWTHDLGLFVFAVLAHWQALTTGGFVMAAVGLYERKKGKNLSWQSYAFIMGMFCLYSVFAAWQDEHRNTAKVIEEKAEYVGSYHQCSEDLRTTQGTLRDKQSLADSLQIGISSLQGPQAQQAANIASCINNLAKLNPAIRRKIVALSFRVGTGKEQITGNIKDATFFEIVIMTNVPTEPTGTLHCDQPFKFMEEPKFPQNNKAFTGILITGPPDPYLSTDHKISIWNSLATWTNENPVSVPVVSSFNDLGACRFTLNTD